MTTARIPDDIGRSTEEIRTHQWMDAFESQLGERAISAMVRFASRRLRGVAKLGGVVDALTPRELVLDILEDVFAGTIAWSPANESLRDIVERTIKSRTYHLRKHAKQFQRTPLDTSTEGGTVAMVEQLTLAPTGQAIESRQLATRVLHELHAMADEDADIQRLLAAYEQGAQHKSDVLELTGMAARTYDRTRKRLNRLVVRISPELRTPIHA